MTDTHRLGSYRGTMAQSDTDTGPNLAPRVSDLRTAEHFGRRVAESVAQFAHGRQALAA